MFQSPYELSKGRSFSHRKPSTKHKYRCPYVSWELMGLSISPACYRKAKTFHYGHLHNVSSAPVPGLVAPRDVPCLCACEARQMRAAFVSPCSAQLGSKLVLVFCCCCFKHNQGSKISTLVHPLTSCPLTGTHWPQRENAEKIKTSQDQFCLEKSRNKIMLYMNI